MGRLLSLVIIFALAAATLPHSLVRAQYTNKQSVRQEANQQQDLGRVFKSYEHIRLDARKAAERVRLEGRLSLVTSRGLINLRLAQNDMRAPNYRAVKMMASGQEQQLSMGPVTTYRGTIEGLGSDTEARFTIDEQHVEGLILTPQERFYLEPTRRYDSRARFDDYILYKASDVRADEESASSRSYMTLNHRVNRALRYAASITPSAIMPQAGTTLRQVELATEADFEYVSKFGSAAAANSEIQTVMNQVDAIYRQEVGLTFKIVFQSAWDTPNDPYNATDLTTMITEFQNYWNTNRTNVPRDLAHMWTGKDTGGVGVSYQGTVCKSPSFAYGISPYVVRNQDNPVQEFALTAHEIGHSFNATHTDGDASCTNTIMNSIATPSTQLTFCQRSRDEITSFVNANSGCLTVVSTAQSTVQLTAANFNVAENDPNGYATVSVTRSGDATQAATVNYRTSDVSGLTPCSTVTGNASERCDYATTVGTLRWAAGETGTKSFIIPIVNDALAEGNETFIVTLYNASGAVLGTQFQASVTILDAPASTQNPIDNPAFFIRQQYIDFLSRLPDPTGFTNWQNTLNNCPNGGYGLQFPDCDRVHVAQSFYQSAEFQNRGYWAYRFYEVGFGRRPNYVEFIPDMAQVGGAKSPAEEEASKQQFINEFVQRQEFIQRYGAITDATQYIDALLKTAGVPNLSIRSTLISQLQSGQITRAQALRLIVETKEVEDKFYNRGFISMLYFGFLRRDADETGFNNYMNNLSQPGDWTQKVRQMVFDFIYSTEYRGRFGNL